MLPQHCCPNGKENTMDPQTTWNELLDAYVGCDWDRAEETATALLEWLDRDGFPPQTVQRSNVGPLFNRHLARAACQFVLDRAKEVRQPS